MSWLVGLFLVFLAAPALAQVPQNTAFAGTLVDDAGIPLVGPVSLDLYLYDAPTGGAVLYSERHATVPLDAQGSFSVLLGTGSVLGLGGPPFDADLFSGADRFLEVQVGSFLPEILSPRVPVASVPWALVAQQATRIVPDPTAPRFEDCGDGTVADHQTGLQWEKKTGTVGSFVRCETDGCPDPHDVNNAYEWSNTGTDPDGNAFTDFLDKLNDPVFGASLTPNEVTGCLAGHCNWRLPTSVELRTIQDCSSSAPCSDPALGPTASALYWSASTLAGFPDRAWLPNFDTPGDVANGVKVGDFRVRAVRPGSCN